MVGPAPKSVVKERRQASGGGETAFNALGAGVSYDSSFVFGEVGVRQKPPSPTLNRKGDHLMRAPMRTPMHTRCTPRYGPRYGPRRGDRVCAAGILAHAQVSAAWRGWTPLRQDFSACDLSACRRKDHTVINMATTTTTIIIIIIITTTTTAATTTTITTILLIILILILIHITTRTWATAGATRPATRRAATSTWATAARSSATRPYIYIYMYIRVSIYLSIYLSLSLSIYIYIHIMCVYIYIYIYIYTHIDTH